MAQQGTDAGVTWRTLIGDSARGERCISVELDPKPSPPVPPSGTGPVDATGRPIPLPPVATPDPGTHHTDGCAPAPSLTDGSSQPLYTLKTHQPDGEPGSYNHAAGTAAPEIEQITIEFSDGTTAPAVVAGGTFIVIYPSSKRLVSLHPAVSKFPKLQCFITSATIPSFAGGPPSFTVYGDGGCSGYTF